MSLTNHGEDKLLTLFKNEGPYYLALFTATPGETGGGTEVSGGSYARRQEEESPLLPCAADAVKNTRRSASSCPLCAAPAPAKGRLRRNDAVAPLFATSVRASVRTRRAENDCPLLPEPGSAMTFFRTGASDCPVLQDSESVRAYSPAVVQTELSSDHGRSSSVPQVSSRSSVCGAAFVALKEPAMA